MSAVPERVRYIIQPIERSLSEHGIVVFVPEKFIKSDLAVPQFTTLDSLSTHLSNPDFNPGDAQDNGYGSYVFTEIIGRQEACLMFVFHRPKITAESRMATKIRPERWTKEKFYWPDVLKSLWGIQGRELGSFLNTQLVPFAYDRYIMVKGGDYQTDILEEEYFSATPFESEELKATEMQPMPVYYKYREMAANFTCLHKEIRVPEFFVSGTLIPDFGFVGEPEQNWSFGAKFTATNFVDWAPHVFSSTPVERDGGYYLKVRTAYPPFSTNKIYS